MLATQPIQPGQILNYQFQGFASVTSPDAASIVNQIGQILSQAGYVVVNSSVQTLDLMSAVASVASTGGTTFTASLSIVDNNVGDSEGTAQAIFDLAVEQASGNPPTSSSIVSISGMPTGLPAQNAPSNPGITPFSTGSLLAIGVVVILIVAIVIAPETPGRVVAAFK